MTDLISRQSAIDALYDWSEHSMTDAEAWHIRQVIGDIKSMPSAQPTAEPVRHGKWIWKGEDGDSRWMCSECKCKEYVPTCNGVPDIWQYCPNCGAEMSQETHND